MNDEGLADVAAASPFRLPRLHPGIAPARYPRNVLDSILTIQGRRRVGQRPRPAALAVELEEKKVNAADRISDAPPPIARRASMPKLIENWPRAGSPLAVALREALQRTSST